MKEFQARTFVAGVATQGHRQQVERKTEAKWKKGVGLEAKNSERLDK